jgi:hypothetical protein
MIVVHDFGELRTEIRLGLAGDGDGGEFTIESRDFHQHPQMCKADGPRRKGSWSVEPERFLEF